MTIPVEWWTIALGLCSLLFVFALGLICGAEEGRGDAPSTGWAMILAAVILALVILAIAGWTQ